MIISLFVFFENFFHIILVKNSGAEPIPIKPLICFLIDLNNNKEIQAPILEPIKIISFFLTIFLIVCFASFAQVEIFPFVNSPEDFSYPEYSSAKKPNLFFLAWFKNLLGLSPSISDAKPGKNII